MKNVTDRTSNPFGMRPPCEPRDDGPSAAFGYGDANADFHLVGDRPARHGGVDTGIPFTGAPVGDAVLDVFRDLEFVAGSADEPDLENLFCSYLHMCARPDRTPTDEEYEDLERFFDAELRAINAHILLPVGERASDHVLEAYTNQRHRFGPELDMDALHATEVRGRGFMVVPQKDPREWTEGDREAIVERLEAILASDYRQTKGVATLVG